MARLLTSNAVAISLCCIGLLLQNTSAKCDNHRTLSQPVHADPQTPRLTRNRFAPLRLEIDMIPIVIAVSASSTAGDCSITVTVTINSVPDSGGTVLLGCDSGDIVAPPSGSSWPYSLSFPGGGSTTESFTISVSTASSTTNVTLYGSGVGVDPTDPSNWSSTAVLTVTSSSITGVRVGPIAPGRRAFVACDHICSGLKRYPSITTFDRICSYSQCIHPQPVFGGALVKDHALVKHFSVTTSLRS